MRYLVALFLLSVPAFAAPPLTIEHHGDAVAVVGADAVTVTAVQSGPWNDAATWDAGFPNPDDVVYIPEGLSVTLVSGHAAVCHDCIIEGELLTEDNFYLETRTATVLPAGHLSLTGKGTLTLRAIPPDDPAQFGCGIVVAEGKLTIQGAEKYPYAKVTHELTAGMEICHLKRDEVPDGWEVGDIVVVPDTRQPEPGDRPGEQTEEVVIASIGSGGFTFQPPLQFDHLGWHQQDGTVGELFHVGNLNQSVVIRSEDPDVVRGHIIVFGHADIQARNFVLEELGRTTTEPLDSLSVDAPSMAVVLQSLQGQEFDSSAEYTAAIEAAAAELSTLIPGDNQIGRYAWHAHHLVGRPDNGREHQFLVEQCVVRGSDKWGMALHHSHYGCYRDSFIYDCAGGHLVTEDPGVYGNVCDRILCIGKRAGSGQRITARSHRNDPKGDHWHNQVGLGLASAANEITGNHVYGCVDGIGSAGHGTTQMRFPLKKGMHPTLEHSDQGENWFAYTNSDGSRTGTSGSYPWAFDTSGNVVWGAVRGIETWTNNSFPDLEEKMFPGLTLVHCYRGTNFEDQRETTTYDWRMLGDFAKATSPEGSGGTSVGLDFKNSYEFGQHHFGMEIRGYGAAYESVYPDEYVDFVGCTFECPTVMYQPLGQYNHDCVTTFTGCEFLPVDGDLTFIDGWYPKRGPESWAKVGHTWRPHLMPISYHLRPWKDGRDLDVYHYAQHKDWELPQGPPPEGKAYADFPVGVWTQQQLIDNGTPIFGGVVPEHAEPFGEHFYAAEVGGAPTLTEQIDALGVSAELKAVLHKLSETRCGCEE